MGLLGRGKRDGEKNEDRRRRAGGREGKIRRMMNKKSRYCSRGQWEKSRRRRVV